MLSLYLVSALTEAQPGTEIDISGDEAHHISRVARHRISERIWLSDGHGHRVTGSIVRIDRDSVTVRIEEVEVHERSKVTLRVVQALTKSDRAHECVELLVAAGVDEIVPWQAERSIGKWDPHSSAEKWEQWIRSAVKQTRRVFLPRLDDHQRELASILAESSGEGEVVIALHEGARISLDSDVAQEMRVAISTASRVTLIIGPEGGLSESELTMLDSSQISRIRLGSPILRSAHAGAIALTALQAGFALWR